MLVSNIIEYTYYVIDCCIIPHFGNPLIHATHLMY